MNPENIKPHYPMRFDGGRFFREETPTFYIDRSETDKVYYFSKEGYKEFYDYLIEIAKQSWDTFVPKEADSLGADYDSYYDKEFDSEGDLSFYGNYGLRIAAPSQEAKGQEIVRLYKFNKRKLESFLFDYAKKNAKL